MAIRLADVKDAALNTIPVTLLLNYAPKRDDNNSII